MIGLRYNEKVNESNPVATLRITSNSPTSPSAINLDPPTAPAHAAPAHAAAVTCSAGRRTATRLTVTCRLNPTLPARRRRIAITLARAGAVITTAKRTITATLHLPDGLRASRYRLTITTAHPATRTTQTIRLPGPA